MGGFNLNNAIMAVIGGMIVLLVGLILMPIVLDQTNETTSNANIDNFSGVEALVELVPLLTVVVVIAIAGSVIFLVVKNIRSRGSE